MSRLRPTGIRPQQAGAGHGACRPGATWPDRPRGTGALSKTSTPPDKAPAHTLPPSAKPAQSCGPPSPASCSEQRGSHWRNADQNQQWQGHPTACTQSDWTCLTHPSRPGLPGTTHLPHNPQRTPPGPGPYRPGRPPQRISFSGPGPSMSRCPPQGRHRHEGMPRGRVG